MASGTKRSSPKRKATEIAGALPAEELKEAFPEIDLPIQPPFPPMEAKSKEEIPEGSGWLYEPKWDGFRCLAYRKGDEVLLQSKAGQPLGRYFPELVESFRQLPVKTFVLDGEIVIIQDGRLSFDDLLMRIHPAESRIRKLSKESPSSFLAFDLIVDEKGESLVELPLVQRQAKLEKLFKKISANGSIHLSASTAEYSEAQRWMQQLAGSGFDGIVAKQLDAAYASGERTAMVKIKNIRTADCVVGGYRYASKGGVIGSLLLGLYDDDGKLNHIGFTSGFQAEFRKKLKAVVEPFEGGTGFTGRAPGGPSRWSTERSAEWVPLKSKLVVEVQYDHFSGGRFRHGTRFLRFRPDKDPKQCTMEQIERGRAGALKRLLAS